MTAFARVSGSSEEAASPLHGAAARPVAVCEVPAGDGFPVEVVEAGPSIAARLVALASRMTIRPMLTVVGFFPHLPLPLRLIDPVCGFLIPPQPGTTRTTIRLPNATAQFVCAPGVRPTGNPRRVVLYLHGGAFVTCGANSHGGIVKSLSRHGDAPVLVVNYRLLPEHSIAMALDDCHDAYRWLRATGYRSQEIVLAGDSAGGYLALALAQRLQQDDEKPAALVAMSPLLQLAKGPKQSHPNIRTDAVLTAKAFDALSAFVGRSAAKQTVDGRREEPYEPLDHIQPELPPVLLHVSGSEVLLYDAQLAAGKLAAAGVPAEVRVWPGQVHVFQLAAPLVPEANRSLRQIGRYIRAITGHSNGSSE
ncbi:esterase [Mycobacterium persicum]|nr:alpha/beta hydrolase [Mycobacterium persicum]KZS83669.1 esterase [Mycobacterium persicum]ORB95027.1 esterase [Mycobacterium persicum]ORC10206.1 esterase [Mycobacterium persicum]VAZ79859.1 Carboxylesterase LipF [Mycobacterium persicum]